MNTIIKNGRVIDPAANFDGVADVFISGNKIVEVKNLNDYNKKY
ncbi:MAG: hypothetical protein NT145_02175 [Elusimicrobia bacterium]|nr:hypothetical protein [Elusimicrobiota bacterium]